MNLKNLYTRSIFGSLYVIVILGCTYIGSYAYQIMLLVIGILLCKEYGKLCKNIYPKYNVTVFVVATTSVLIIGVAMMLQKVFESYDQLLSLAILYMLFLCLPWVAFALSRRKVIPQQLSIVYGIGLCWIALPLCLLLIARQANLLLWSTSYYAPLSIFLCIWVNDTSAYLVGSSIGRTKLSTSSPKKTWEGLIGGILICTIAMGYTMFHYGWILDEIHAIGLAFFIAIGGTIGDLIESRLKRQAGVKDSGKVLPGHGGMLDRFDSVLVATTFAMCYNSFITIL